ncbi:MAG: DNA-binding transcriptional regulator GbsR (MarR family) [Oleiphilaceae bacterium]|jgi:DNA-binding transcriptional regulator GbsR (MarR family)
MKNNDKAPTGSSINVNDKFIKLSSLKSLFNENKILLFKTIRLYKDGVTIDHLIETTGLSRRVVESSIKYFDNLEIVEVEKIVNIGHGKKLLVKAKNEIIISID